MSGGESYDWEQRKLGEVAEFNPKSALPDSFEYVDLESVVGTDLVNHRTEDKATAPSRAQRLAKCGDIFYQTVRPYQKNNCLFDLPYNNYVFSTGYAQMRPHTDSRFLFSRLQEERFVKAVLDRCTGTSYPAINANDLSEIEIKVPCDINEQVKIGMMFKSLDSFITLHQEKLMALKRLKKVFTQVIFPQKGENVPRLRFADFHNKWEQRKLRDISEIVGGGTLSTSNPEYWNGDIDWYSPTEIGDCIYTNGSVKTITQLGLEKSSAKILPSDKTVLFTSRAGIGNMAILQHPGATNQGFQSLVLNDDIDTYFIYSMEDLIKKYALKNASGSTFLEISGKTLGDMPILIPSTNEQIKIGTLFKNIDNLIILHKKKIKKLQLLKKAYLQKMFI